MGAKLRSVKDISLKLYILWEKELIEARKGREQFFLSQNVQFEAFILLKNIIFFVLILDSVRLFIQKCRFPLSIVFAKTSLAKLILLFTYWRVWGKFQGL